MMTWAQLGFQDAMSPVMEEFIFFHDYTMVVLVLIISFVSCIMLKMTLSPWIHRSLLEGQMIECVWTLMPAIILIQIAIPSLLLLYLLEEGVSASLSMKVIGHQWYWSYEYSDFWYFTKMLEFDSYMLPLEESVSVPRLLDVDNRTPVPFNTQMRILVGSSDVLHSWTVPSMGVKVDACPGRLNQVNFISHRPGLVFGQCSEICGANHSFMPISLEVISSKDFLTWVETSME